MRTLLNGRDADAVAVADRGLQYGDGLFETIAVRAGQALLWHAHLRRLTRGLTALGLPAVDIDVLESEVNQVIAGADHGVLKVLLTAGTGGRGYSRATQPVCNRVVSLHPFPDHPLDRWVDGVRVRVCETRLAVQPRLAGIKHCNRLEQVLARSEWSDPMIAEGLMLDMGGCLTEGTMSNVFGVRGNRILTPSLTNCGVHGVMRETMLSVAEDVGYLVEFLDAPLADWRDVDELFLTNSVIGLWPVREVEDRLVGPGPVSRMLQRHLAEAGAAAMPIPDGG
ncbi:MAG: aminodeoxychorismate lyase [Aquisalimonadaceae bacterium]